MKLTHKIYSFALVFRGVSEPNAAIEDALYEAGCDDALLSFRAGIAYLDFDREAPSFELALLSAIRDVESSAEHLRVVRVEPGDLVTASEIARRARLTREYVRLLVKGARGAGNFPAPRSGLTSKTLVWSWAEVSQWLLEHSVIDDENFAEAALVLRDLNAALEVRENPATKTRRAKYHRELKAIQEGAGGALRRGG